MSDEARKQYIQMLWKRYQECSKSEKALIIDELVRNLLVHRKSAIRMMNKSDAPKKKPGAKPSYDKVTIEHLRKIWILMDYICGKRMKAAIPEWLPYYDCDEKTKLKLGRMSASTIDRVLKPFRAEHKRKGNTGTKPGYLKNKIPIKPLDWTVHEPGFMEADTVAHCGNSLSGSFAWSLTMTDIYSGWTMNKVVWQKLSGKVIQAIDCIEKQIPFDLRGFSSDNGNEFLNESLLRFFRINRIRQIGFQRGRPYRKNDQCHVEQKNWTHVRQLFGYGRIDDESLIEFMDEIYEEWNLLQNFFLPQMKLKSKMRLGARYQRQYTEPLTPYSRLIASDKVTSKNKKKLRDLKSSLNPILLKRSLDKKLAHFNELLNKQESLEVLAS